MRIYSKQVALITIAFTLGGCTTMHDVHFYNKNEVRTEDVVTLSIASYSTTVGAGVVEIDGRSVENYGAISYKLAPGKHELKIRVMADVTYGNLSMKWKEASIPIIYTMKAGHTYAPVAIIIGDKASARLDDLGQNFPYECIPLNTRIKMEKYGYSFSDENVKKCAGYVSPEKYQ